VFLMFREQHLTGPSRTAALPRKQRAAPNTIRAK
jgi:hypothetical protein